MVVDLAGSERLDRSGVTGDRVKEAMAINKSLSSLSDVYLAIGTYYYCMRFYDRPVVLTCTL